MEKNIIYHVDCIEGMKILPDNLVDMVLTDPPYKCSSDAAQSSRERISIL